MTRLAIAMDLGTSGFRAQALDLGTGEILSGVLTMRHPLPGINVMDQLHCALHRGGEAAHELVIRGVNRIIHELGIPAEQVERLAVCGNPIQVALFQGTELRDLAFAGKRKLASLEVVPPERDGAMVAARDIPGLRLVGPCQVLIPPSVCHEVGGDALAMIMQSGMQERGESAFAIDLGSNAEVALSHGAAVFTGSTAAGPALEGQGISCGRQASPGVVVDLEADGPHHRLILLGADLRPLRGALVDLGTGQVLERGGAPDPVGISGSGTIALVTLALEAGLIELPRIRTADSRLHPGERLFFTEDDLAETGKAVGAVRAGWITLCHEAGITPADISTAFLSGASGSYGDAIKLQRLGLLPPRLKTVVQAGNTSLAMARELARSPERLGDMIRLAKQLRPAHCMFAASAMFQKVYLLELSRWSEGMPMYLYRKFLGKYGVADLPPVQGTPAVIRAMTGDRDMPGLRFIDDRQRSG